MFAASRSLEVLSRGIATAERDAASCGFARCKQLPGGVRRNRPSATTSGTCECANARPRAPLMCTAQPSRQGGPEPITAAVERREASVLRHWTRSASQALAGVRHSPAVGCRCTRAPFGAPLPPGRGGKRRGENANLGGLMPRENDDACLEETTQMGKDRSKG